MYAFDPVPPEPQHKHAHPENNQSSCQNCCERCTCCTRQTRGGTIKGKSNASHIIVRLPQECRFSTAEHNADPLVKPAYLKAIDPPCCTCSAACCAMKQATTSSYTLVHPGATAQLLACGAGPMSQVPVCNASLRSGICL